MSDMPRVIWIEPQPATWGAYLFHDNHDIKSGTSYTRTDLVDELIYTLNLRHQSEDVLLVMAALQGEGK